MTPARAVAQETRKASSWADSTAIRLWNAETALQAAILRGDGPDTIRARHELEGLERLHDQAVEDVVGWRRLSRKLK